MLVTFFRFCTNKSYLFKRLEATTNKMYIFQVTWYIQNALDMIVYIMNNWILHFLHPSPSPPHMTPPPPWPWTQSSLIWSHFRILGNRSYHFLKEVTRKNGIERKTRNGNWMFIIFGKKSLFLENNIWYLQTF